MVNEEKRQNCLVIKRITKRIMNVDGDSNKDSVIRNCRSDRIERKNLSILRKKIFFSERMINGKGEIKKISHIVKMVDKDKERFELLIRRLKYLLAMIVCFYRKKSLFILKVNKNQST